ncbi:TadE/TadG family type IV pilus assembly protein [Numidum massiliense]|uniref:TadE/TadG family type IV pilus assembly protein n=1 Tax=Numidum massiliense TaxID=1522315 RepID=UPI0006D52AC2|nr:TadE family protein [Numidum massiliense]
MIITDSVSRLRTFRRESDGSMTLEAAMLLPVFLLFVMLLITMIRLAIAEVALNHAASDTAGLIATHAYPASVVWGKANKTIDDKIKEGTAGVLNLDHVKKLLDKVIQLFGKGSAQEIFTNQSKALLTSIMQDKFAEYANDDFFKKDKVKVTDLTVPNLNGSQPYLKLTVEYKLKINAPFINKELKLRKQVSERLWIGK